MYSLRDVVASSSLEDAVKLIANAGFNCVETAGMPLKAKEYKELLEKYNLKTCSAHVGLGSILNDFKQVAEDAKIMGYKDIVIPNIEIDKVYDDLDKSMQDFNKAAQLCKNEGLILSYHNHDFEFINGKNLLFDLYDNVPDINFEIDLFWLVAAKKSYQEIYNKLGKRITILHAKEMGEGGKDSPNPILGQGVADLDTSIEFTIKNNKIDTLILEFEKLDINGDKYLKGSYNFLNTFLKNN